MHQRTRLISLSTHYLSQYPLYSLMIYYLHLQTTSIMIFVSLLVSYLFRISWVNWWLWRWQSSLRWIPSVLVSLRSLVTLFPWQPHPCGCRPWRCSSVAWQYGCCRCGWYPLPRFRTCPPTSSFCWPRWSPTLRLTCHPKQWMFFSASQIL